jgi:bifunctional non-homologous end joining protein LigD
VFTVASEAPPSGPGWIHEVKRDRFRILARRDSAGVRLITRNGNDFTSRFPPAVDAVTRLPAHSFPALQINFGQVFA